MIGSWQRGRRGSSSAIRSTEWQVALVAFMMCGSLWSASATATTVVQFSAINSHCSTKGVQVRGASSLLHEAGRCSSDTRLCYGAQAPTHCTAERPCLCLDVLERDQSIQ